MSCVNEYPSISFCFYAYANPLKLNCNKIVFYYYMRTYKLMQLLPKYKDLQHLSFLPEICRFVWEFSFYSNVWRVDKCVFQWIFKIVVNYTITDQSVIVTYYFIFTYIIKPVENIPQSGYLEMSITISDKKPWSQ